MKRRIVTIAAEKLHDPEIAPEPSYVLRSADGQTEILSDEIHGFTFEQGVEQEVELGVSEVANPPQGASSLRYDLLRVIAKRRR